MMTQYKTIYKCGRCGTTSYQPVIGRDATGALKPTGQYRCTGCKMTFSEFREWWGHDGAAHAPGLSGGSPLSALSMSSALG
jgi:DNA-directed RNA polymerase subunit RPC12/RpoP